MNTDGRKNEASKKVMILNVSIIIATLRACLNFLEINFV